jgi:hydroxymethylpyrimidine kinase/phosphomethylpyrimidine kinase/thiamine-phosphate diphosphorylase
MNPVVWTIAGSDSSGCAGIQADLKTFQNFGVHGCSIVTAVTSQNTHQLNHIEYISNDVVASQIHILQQDLMPTAIKIGMFNQPSLFQFLSNYNGFVILDPLVHSTSGKNLFSGDFNEHLLNLKRLFPLLDLLTPNIFETEKITGYKIQSYQDIIKAADDILLLGVKSVLIKGGHFGDKKFSQDYWTNGVDAFWISHKRIFKDALRGIGCTLSSAITACLALGYDIKDATVLGKMYVHRGIRLTENEWLMHSGWPHDHHDFPYISRTPLLEDTKHFPTCGINPLGLYPIVDNSKWLKQLLSLGVTTIQLRIKNKFGIELEKEIKEGIEIAKKYNARLFINDYWELAILYGAYGVHLGQDDLNDANIKKIHAAGLRLGISTHCLYEAAIAHALCPSYIAYGPIFSTKSKQMLFNPQGLDKLKYWQQILNYPIVAIGGIDQTKFSAVLKTKVNGIAMISAIVNALDPIKTTQEFLYQINDAYEETLKCI